MRALLCTVLLLCVLVIGACHPCCPKAVLGGPQAARSEPNAVSSQPMVPPETPPASPAEMSLFDGKTLGHWKPTDFGGQGKVYVKDESILLEVGNDMTGVTWDGPLVRMNYEITLEAMRISGSDFFCGLTFPVDANHCSLVLGGWGGTLCGLSNIDYYDAANNETTRFVAFENDKWYHVRLSVTPGRIQAWLDNEEEALVDMDITSRKIDTRIEMDLCQPMGIATWQTRGAIRNIKLRKLP
ncbi:MAG: hypothetical protein A2Z25_00230 [Planctomycetes bacterium RBG_16_55_9]|nr:MAG: hypothetical protein A2Z25_00230 [Planctomycetes bacterium RBG_16_55_9]